jgi:ADP-dependent glucokinase
LKFFFLISIIIVVSSLFFSKYEIWNYIEENFFLKKEEEWGKILNELQKIVNIGESTINCTKIAIGYNSNLDLIVSGIEVLKNLNLKPISDFQDFMKISNLTQFHENFLYFFEKGIAGERYIDNPELFEKILESTINLKNKQWDIGGNAAIMANKFAMKGCSSILLSGAIGEKLSSLLHSSIKIISNLNQTKDEIHLILEYEKYSNWGRIIAPRSNRFIIHNDQSNSEFKYLESFHKEIKKFHPSLFVISGLHLLDGKKTRIFKRNYYKNTIIYS